MLSLLGTVLVVSSANALNMWWERDVDARMGRTADRPLPSGRLSARDALVFGLALGVLARPGDAPGEAVVQALRQALAHDPATRGAPGAFGRKLRELAVALASPGLRTWAPGSIPAVVRFGPAAAADAPRGVVPLPVDDAAARTPLGAGQTIAPPASRRGPGRSPWNTTPNTVTSTGTQSSSVAPGYTVDS
jgi:hypothetical protein